MANIKIAQLTNKTTLADTDLVIVESATQTQKMTLGNLKNLLGIDSGGIKESGSNAYGSYVKYADGTLECYGRIDLVYQMNKVLTKPATFPTYFITTPSVALTFIHGERNFTVTALDGWVLGLQSLSKQAMDIRVWSMPVAFSEGDTLPVTWRAIGRWK